MIVIIDYGLGNLASVLNMFRKIGVREVCISNKEEEIIKAQKILLPGVGAFDAGMENLDQSGLIPLLNKKVLEEKVPLLGICLGMQLLGTKSEEGIKSGLGWIDAETIKLNPPAEMKLKIPHMGWNYVNVKRSNLFIDKEIKNRFYFVHSYHVKCKNDNDSLATCNYGIDFTCIINKDNIFGVQFHPEKSLKFGMKVLENFSKI